MTADVRFILVDVRRVHDHQDVIGAGPVDDHVVDDRPAFVAQQSVPRLSDGEPRDVARDEAIDGGERRRCVEMELAHM